MWILDYIIPVAKAHAEEDYFGHHMFDMSTWGFMGFFWMIFFWILVVFAVVAMIKFFSGEQKPEKKEKSALDILGERYAKGEIDKKEFEEKKKDLSS